MAVKPTKTNGKAIASLALSIASLLLWPFAIVGVILGFVARSEIAKRDNETGENLALVGIILGFIFGIIGILVSATLLCGAAGDTGGYTIY